MQQLIIDFYNYIYKKYFYKPIIGPRLAYGTLVKINNNNFSHGRLAFIVKRDYEHKLPFDHYIVYGDGSDGSNRFLCSLPVNEFEVLVIPHIEEF